ncbi:MAG: VOC family protein [Micropruina sp.]|nr:VOC family protein [Micropruina sp.]
MLADYAPMPTLGVADLQAARDFYEGVLGFSPQVGDLPDGVLYAAAGSGSFLVYPSGFAGTNKATAMSFMVPLEEFEASVAMLREKGVDFQTFELEGLVWEDGVAVMGETRSVWFEDPDGNILNIETGMMG